MPGKKEDRSVIQRLFDLYNEVDAEAFEDHPDIVKAGLTNVARSIQQLSDQVTMVKTLSRS